MATPEVTEVLLVVVVIEVLRAARLSVLDGGGVGQLAKPVEKLSVKPAPLVVPTTSDSPSRSSLIISLASGRLDGSCS